MAVDPNGDRPFWSGVEKQELPHCGACDPVTRHIERDDGRIARCPDCHPLQDALLPQHWRCPICRALIYRDQRGMPCDKHRTVIGWRHAYDAAQSGADTLMPNATTETGAKSARTLLAHRPRPEAEPATDQDPPEVPDDDWEPPF
jgi:hypothetical protein